MDFDLSSAVDVTPDKKMVNTTSFDLASAQDIPEKPKPNTEPGFLVKFLRGISSQSPIEQMNTGLYELSKIKDGTIPNTPGRQPNESVADWEERIKPDMAIRDQVMSEREKKEAGKGVFHQVEPLMMAGMAEFALARPAAAALSFAGSSLYHSVFDARQFVEDKYPNASGNFKDMAEVVGSIPDILLGVKAVHGENFIRKNGFKNSLDFAKTSLNNFFNSRKGPVNVEITPEHISAIQNTDVLTPAEKISTFEELGIERKHIDASLSNNIAVKVPLDSLIDSAQLKHWDKVKSIISEADYKKAEVPRETPQDIQKRYVDLQSEMKGILEKETLTQADYDRIPKINEEMAKVEEAQINDVEAHIKFLEGLATDQGKMDAMATLKLPNTVKRTLMEHFKLVSEPLEKAPSEKVKIPDFSKKEFSSEKAEEFALKATPEEVQMVMGRLGELNARKKELLDKGENRTDLEDAEGFGIHSEVSKINEFMKVAEGAEPKSPGLKKAFQDKKSPPPAEPPPPEPVKPPEGEGETKVRTLAKGVEEKAIEKKLTEGFGDLPQYEVVSMKEQAQKASDLLNADYQQAKRIAMGQERPPQDVLPESVFVAVENRAIKEGDINTLMELAQTSKLVEESTTMGQRIRTLGERDPESPVGAMQDIASAREKGVKDLKSEKKKIVKEIKAEIKKTAPSKETWASFIKSLEC